MSHNPTYSLDPHQKRVIEEVFAWFYANPTGNPIVNACVASGKSVMIAEFCRIVMTQWPDQRILMVVASKELVVQNYEKLRSIYPAGDFGLYSASAGKKNPHAKIVFATIGSIYNKAMHTGAFSLCLIDECFVAGTQIKTPTGYKKIEDINIGDEIVCAIGKSTVLGVSKKESNRIVEVLLNDGTRIKCTEDHPFFTTKGWIEASKVEGETVIREQDMSSLWRGFQAEHLCLQSSRTRKNVGKEDVLFAKMLRRKRAKIYCTPSPNSKRIVTERKNSTSKTNFSTRKNRNLCFLRKRVCNKRYINNQKTEMLQQILCKEVEKPNGPIRHKRKNVKNTEIYRSQAENYWREWQKINRYSASNAKYPWLELDSRVSNKNTCRSQKRCLSELLQGRYWQRRVENCDRVRWTNSFWKANRIGQEKRQFSIGIGVENVSNIKQGCYETVFNLRISGHPSYFANGILVHNCHNVSRKETGMYRQMIAEYTRLNPLFRVLGFTGTPFRGNGILLTQGDEAIFTAIAATVTIREMLDAGYLAPLVLAETKTKTDVSGVHISNATGDYKISELAKAIDQDSITKSACAEIIEKGRDRKSWLIFGVDVEHCQHIHEEMQRQTHGELKGAVVSGTTPAALRDRILANFKAGKLRYVVNCMVLTVGFDAPAVDLIALIRNTRSPVLYVQIGGRGMRKPRPPAPPKRDCLWLDFTDTTSTLGPIDQVKGRTEVKRLNSSSYPTTTNESIVICPQCQARYPVSTQVCECGYKFIIRSVNANAVSSDAPILSVGEPTRFIMVDSWRCRRHFKLGKPDTMCVSYSPKGEGNLSGEHHNEWLCFDHKGYARTEAEKWWLKMGGELPFPVDVSEALRDFRRLKKPDYIEAVKEGKFMRIINHGYLPAIPNTV